MLEQPDLFPGETSAEVLVRRNLLADQPLLRTVRIPR